MENNNLTYAQLAAKYLAHDIAKNFIKNSRRAGTLNHKVKNIELAISTAFVWPDTREGEEFWGRVEKEFKISVAQEKLKS